MSFMSSQARTPLVNSHSRLSPFNSNKRISPPSQAQGPSAKVVVVISDSETDSEDGFLGSSSTRAATASANMTIGVKRTRNQNNSSVIELSSNDDSDEDNDNNPFDDTHLASKSPRPSTPHPQQQPSPSALSTTSSRSSSPLLHIYRPPQPRPRPIRRSRNPTNLQASAPLIERQEGQRTTPGVGLPHVVTLSELKDAMGRMNTIEQKQAIEHHIDDDDQDEPVRKFAARLENASQSIEVEKIKEEEEEKGSEVKDIEDPDGCGVAPAELCTSLGVMTEAHDHTTLREEAMDEKATTEGAGCITEDQMEDIRKIKECISSYLSPDQALDQSLDQSPGGPIASDDHTMDTTSDGDPEPVHQEAEPGTMDHETEADSDSFIDIETFTDDIETFTDDIETFTGAKDVSMTESEDFDEDFDYDADYILGGEFQVNLLEKAVVGNNGALENLRSEPYFFIYSLETVASKGSHPAHPS